MIALVESETIQGINEVIHSKIRSIDKVRSTLTLVCIPPEGGGPN